MWLLRVCAYVFHLLLSLFLVGIGVMALISGEDLALGMLPWKGPALTRAVLLIGVIGVICVALTVTGAARWIFPLWTLFALIMLLRGFFLSPYISSSAAEFHAALGLAGAALLAFLVSFSLFWRPRKRI